MNKTSGHQPAQSGASRLVPSFCLGLLLVSAGVIAAPATRSNVLSGTLVKPLDARKTKTGDAVEVQTNEALNSRGQIIIEKGRS